MADKNLISFWAYINKYVISIPIIQRDYAQGREGKEYLRRNFLTSIKKALDDPSQPLVLDFVYGGLHGKDRGIVSPLDGQQRLTTLWLLHWYIAFKAGILDCVSKTLKRFHYRTRISSDEFIQHLCDLGSFEEEPGVSLRKYITSQRWYRTNWDSDPTIKSMLTMIQGTSLRDKDGDIIDGLEEVFYGCSKADYEKYWRLLESGTPISFYEYALGDEDLPETDSLYVKMNARGKPLTDFENFKADLFNHLKTKAGCSEEEICTIGAWFDNGGADLFWQQTNKEENNYVIDEAFYVFLRRYFLKKLIDDTISDSIESVINRKSFKLLFSSNDNQDDASYKDFSSYEDLGNRILSKETFSDLQSLSSAIQGIKNINSLCAASWASAKLAYVIPQYLGKSTNGAVSGITVKGRIVFSSVIDYLQNNKGAFNESSFKDWIRFVWNVIEGTDTSGTDNLVQISRFLHELASQSGSIISYLAEKKLPEERDSELKRQYIEEIVKAQRINELRKKKEFEPEKLIYTAEKACFYKGCIRFLYTMEDGHANWEEFPTKYRNSLKLFNSKGVTTTYRDNSLLLCYFISIQTKWNQITYLEFSNDAETWRQILRRERYRKCLHGILLSPESVKPVESSYKPRLEEADEGYEELERAVQKDLCNHVLMNNIVESMESRGRLHWRYNHYCVYPPNARADWKKYIIADCRNEIIFELVSNGTITLDQERRIGNSGFIWGWDIPFTYKGKTYCWDAFGNLKYYSESRPQRPITARDTESFLSMLD